MDKLQKALARLKELGTELEALLNKEAPTAEDFNAIEAKTAEMTAKQREIDVLKAAEAARASLAEPADTPLNTQQERTVEPTVERKLEPHEKLSIAASATLKAQVTKTPALKVLADAGYAPFAKECEGAMRRKQIDTTALELLIPESISNQVIDFLRPQTTFFQGGPKRIQFTNGKFKAPRGLTGATASYVGEGQKKPVTDVTFDSIEMSPKKLAAIVLITQEARDWSIINIDAYIRDDLRQEMAQKIDLNAFFGTGAGLSPTGITTLPGVPRYEVAAFGGDAEDPAITVIDAVASRMILSLTQANIGAAPSWAWLMSYRTLEFLKNKRVGDDTGVYAYPELRMPMPTWKGFRVLVTNQVAENLGDGTDETTLTLIDFRYVLYGDEGGLVVKTSDQATVDVNGTLVLLWQQNMYGILTEHQHDFGLQYDNAVAVVDGIRWGAGLYDVGVGSPSAS